MRLAINGISGKMGSYLYNYLKERNDWQVVCGLSRQNLDLPIPIYKDIKSCLENEQFDTLIDFTHYPSCLEVVKQAIIHNINVVSGTTGYKKYDEKLIKYLATKHNVGVVISPNFSLLSQDIADLIYQIKKLFPYCEIIETHGIHKKDKPSGTAKYFANLMNLDYAYIHSVRLPGIIADHTLTFADEYQSLTITHRINNRQAFIAGIEKAIIDVTNLKKVEILI
ncbi:MAG: dihydrodipicolinate reductase [Bacilli bacterium]|nr:dihydrodipicolinate reductase [Bacilli bacterium]